MKNLPAMLSILNFVISLCGAGNDEIDVVKELHQLNRRIEHIENEGTDYKKITIQL